MRKALALAAAVCMALSLAGCDSSAERPEASAAPGYYDDGAEAAERSDWPAAVDAFSRAIEADDHRASAYAGRADCYLALAGREEEEGTPDLKSLAMRDYEIAVELDPGQGPHIYEACAALGADALAAGSADEALLYLHTAYIAADDEQADEIGGQVTGLTAEILTGSVWYMDAPDSRYYEFFADGTGRTVDAAAMAEEGSLTYQNEGFALAIKSKDGTGTWTYEPDRGSYYTTVRSEDGTERPLRLERSSPRRMYALWQADILAEETDLRLNPPVGGEGPAAGYGVLYEREYALAEALAVSAAGALTEEDNALLAAERERRTALREDASVARDAFGQIRRTVDTLLTRLPDTPAPESGYALEEMFPVGEQTLLDYFRLLAGWVLNGRTLCVQDGGEAPAAWDTLGEVDHYFKDGRLYLRLNGYALQTGGRADTLAPDEHGKYAFETPLSFGDNVNLTGEELLSRLQETSWISLSDSNYGDGVFFLELDLAGDSTCTARGGHYPGELSGAQSGEYALHGSDLTLTLSAGGYTPGTYQYAVRPMGDSLYMTLLTDGAVYGQTAGDACVFCGGDYAGGVRARLD